MLHRFLAAGGALGFLHQANVLVFEVGQFLLHSLISRYTPLRGFRFIGRNVLTVRTVAPIRVDAFCLIPNLVSSSRETRTTPVVIAVPPCGCVRLPI